MSKVLFALAVLIALPAAAADEPDHAIHEELRGVLATVEKAITEGRYDDMLPVISENIRATASTQEIMSSRDEVSAYFRHWFGPGGYLKRLNMTLTPDALTELSADRTWGLVRGSGMERYTLADGRLFDMSTRWTAVMQKDSDDKWRLRSIHIGSNYLDNPILAAAKNAVVKVGLLCAGGGLIIGALLGFLTGRRRKQ